MVPPGWGPPPPSTVSDLVGALTVTQQSLRPVSTGDVVLVTATAAPGSSSAAALHLLAGLVHAGPASPGTAPGAGAPRAVAPRPATS